MNPDWQKHLNTKPVYAARRKESPMPKMQEALYRIPQCTAIRETEKALLIHNAEWDDDMWFPHSQITDDSEVYADGTEGTLIVTEWIAKQKGLC
jgi:hypothetical protein